MITSTTTILEDYKLKNGDNMKRFDIYTISPWDNYNWDASIYWYLIEKKIKKKISYIDFHSNKAFRKSQEPGDFIYLICHNIAKNETIPKCLNEYLKQKNNNPVIVKRFDFQNYLTVFKLKTN